MSVSMRVVSENVMQRMEELRDSSIEGIKEKAREVNKAVDIWDVRALKSEGFSKFCASVESEFSQEEERTFANLMKGSFKRDILGSPELDQEIQQILGNYLE